MAGFTVLGVLLVRRRLRDRLLALGYLRRFPVSALKIDRSFVAGLNTSPDDAALVEAIVRLAQTFDLDLVAEGVETGAQSLILSRLRLHQGPGLPLLASAAGRRHHRSAHSSTCTTTTSP